MTDLQQDVKECKQAINDLAELMSQLFDRTSGPQEVKLVDPGTSNPQAAGTVEFEVVE